MYGVRPPLLAQPDGEHLRRPALHGSPERGVGLDPVDHDDRVGLVSVTVHVDGARGCLPEPHALHRRPHGTPDLLLVHAEVREHLRLAFRGRGAVAPHRGDDERLGARVLKASTSAATTSPILATPLLPTPMATEPEGSSTEFSASRTPSLMSVSAGGESIRCPTSATLGSSIARRISCISS